MTASNISITQGSGTRLATNSYLEGGVTVNDEKVILGEQYLASYTTGFDNAYSTGTLSSHLLQIMAGASLRVRIRRIICRQAALATAVAQGTFSVVRLTTAGTGGTSYTPSRLDPADAASGATVMGLPTSKGTEGAFVASCSPVLIQTLSATVPTDMILFDLDFDRMRSGPLVIPAGTANGIAIKNQVAVAGASVSFNVWFSESSF